MVINTRLDVFISPPDKTVYGRNPIYIPAQGYIVNYHSGDAPYYTYDSVTRKSCFIGEPLVTVWLAKDCTAHLFYKKHDTGEVVVFDFFKHLCDKGFFEEGVRGSTFADVPKGTDPYSLCVLEDNGTVRYLRSPITITDDTTLSLCFVATTASHYPYRYDALIKKGTMETPFGYIDSAWGFVYGKLSFSYAIDLYRRNRITGEYEYETTYTYNKTLSLPLNFTRVYSTGFIYDDYDNANYTLTPEPNLFMFEKRHLVRTTPNKINASYIEFANLAEYQAAVNIAIGRVSPQGVPHHF